MNSAPTFTAPPLPTVLTHLSAIGPFVHATHPARIATEWTAARDVIAAYGIENGDSCPKDHDGAHAFKKGVIEQLQMPLSKAIIARAGEMDAKRLNGHGRIIDAIGSYVDVGVITPHASDVLVESAALAIGMNGKAPLSSLADLLTAATTYMTGADEPSDEILMTLANALGHHGITLGTLRFAVDNGKRAEVLMRSPYVSLELENRLFRIVANVRNVDHIEKRYGLTEMHVMKALEAGVLSRPAGEGLLRVWRERDELYRKEHFWYGINRGLTLVLGTFGIVSLLFMLDNIRFIGAREAKAMIYITLGSFGVGLFTGAMWLFSPVRYKE